MSRPAAVKNNLRESYLDGNISVSEYVNRILNGKEGDRKRRKIVQKQTALLNKFFTKQ